MESKLLMNQHRRYENSLFILAFVLIAAVLATASTFVGNSQHIQPWAVQNTLLAADATKTLRAAPGANLQLVVTNIECTILTSAAQAVDVQDTSGTVFVLRLPVSVAVGLEYENRLEEGLKLTANEALIIKPAAAGPSLHCVAEGYVVGAR